MQEYSESAIKSSVEAEVSYCKFITPNDVGATGGHQAGYHIHKDSFSLMFSEPGERGQNREKTVKIRWQDSFETTSNFKYYGQGTRNEYRLTAFGRGFPFQNEENIGSLLILCKISDEYYKAYVLETEYEIENYLSYFNLSPTEANGLVSEVSSIPSGLGELIERYVKTLDIADAFPATQELSETARNIFQQVNNTQPSAAVNDPDSIITNWVDTEYSLFKAVERSKYQETLSKPFNEVDTLIKFASSLLNRRKSRAGKSLENHLATIFDINKLPYSAQKETEGRKKPDFIIPSIEQYHDDKYSADKLVFLGVKTTCKDRWRQVLNEAARTPNKHLFTLQPGISSNQLDEMKDENLTLVVPEKNIVTFPPQNRTDIMTLKTFIEYSKDRLK